MKQKPKPSNWIFRTALCFAIFASGVVVGKLINITYFSIDEKVNVFDILSICATLFAAWYISGILEKEKQDNRTEKDLILRRTEDIYQLIDDSHQKVVSGSIPFQDATSHLKRINTSIKSIYKVLASTALTTDGNLKNQIFNNTRKLRDLLTNTPIISPQEIQSSNLPVSVVNGIIHLSQNRIAEIEGEYDKLKDNILFLQIAINKA
jgi:hypothetical protein